MSRFYVNRSGSGQPEGPLDEEQVAGLIAAGLSEAWICPEDGQSWSPLASHPPFARLLAARQAPTGPALSPSDPRLRAYLRRGARASWSGGALALVVLVTIVALGALGLFVTQPDFRPYVPHLLLAVGLIALLWFGRTNVVASPRAVGFFLGRRRSFRAFEKQESRAVAVRHVQQGGGRRTERFRVVTLSFQGGGQLRWSTRWISSWASSALEQYAEIAAAAAQPERFPGVLTSPQTLQAITRSAGGSWFARPLSLVAVGLVSLCCASGLLVDPSRAERVAERAVSRSFWAGQPSAPPSVPTVAQQPPAPPGAGAGVAAVATAPGRSPGLAALTFDGTVQLLRSWGYTVESPIPESDPGSPAMGSLFASQPQDAARLALLDFRRLRDPYRHRVRPTFGVVLDLDGPGGDPERVLDALTRSPITDARSLEAAMRRGGFRLTEAPVDDADEGVRQLSCVGRSGELTAYVRAVVWAHLVGPGSTAAHRSDGPRLLFVVPNVHTTAEKARLLAERLATPG